jgi:hypothetical protein
MRARLVPVCVLILCCSLSGSISMAMAEPLPELEVNQCNLEESSPTKAELPMDVLEAVIFQATSCTTADDCPCPAPACGCVTFRGSNFCLCQTSLCCFGGACP